jgi:hypothetical protein
LFSIGFNNGIKSNILIKLRLQKASLTKDVLLMLRIIYDIMITYYENRKQMEQFSHGSHLMETYLRLTRGSEEVPTKSKHSQCIPPSHDIFDFKQQFLPSGLVISPAGVCQLPGNAPELRAIPARYTAHALSQYNNYILTSTSLTLVL